MTHSPNKHPSLAHAWQSLDLLHRQVQKDAHGDLEGIDALHLGLDGIAYDLAQLTSFPVSDEEPSPEDVFAYLHARRLIETSTLEDLVRARDEIRTATYKELDQSGMDTLNQAARGLHAAIEKLLQKLAGGAV